MIESTDTADDDRADDPMAGDSAAATAPVELRSDEPAESSEHTAPSDVMIMVGIRIRESSRIYHFAAPRGQVFVGDYVVVDRARGEQLARVVTVADADAQTRRIPHDVRPIVRLADADDRDRATQQGERANQILQEMRSAAVHDELGFYPVAVELNLDGDRGTAWFQAPEHVDFRPLLEQVEREHDVELHMRQANQRERARLVDGYDICGLRLCCASWMTDFPHVGIRVAKDQNLSLNPDSISGVCGRLLCCLTFEHEVYREMRGTLPRVGKRVSTPAGMGKVIKLNVLQQKVTLALDDHPQRVEVPAEEIGLAVRTEDAPNQALVDAEREQRQADQRAADLRRAADPQQQSTTTQSSDPSLCAAPSNSPGARAKRRRRRARASQSDRTAMDGDDQPVPSDPPRGSGREGGRKHTQQHGRRRRTPIANQSRNESRDVASGTQPRPPDGESQRTRRRRRSRQPVNRPQQDDESST